jgi:hypothetical protein
MEKPKISIIIDYSLPKLGEADSSESEAAESIGTWR